MYKTLQKFPFNSDDLFLYPWCISEKMVSQLWDLDLLSFHLGELCKCTNALIFLWRFCSAFKKRLSWNNCFYSFCSIVLVKFFSCVCVCVSMHSCVGSSTFTTCTRRPENNLRCCPSVFPTFCVSQEILLAGTLPCQVGDLLDKLQRICLFLLPISL